MSFYLYEKHAVQADKMRAWILYGLCDQSRSMETRALRLKHICNFETLPNAKGECLSHPVKV